MRQVNGSHRLINVDYTYRPITENWGHDTV